MNSVAVIFPGTGYHTDKPLLYYTKKLFKECGYQIMEVAYSNFPQNVKGNKEKMEQAFLIAKEQAEQMLENVDFGEYDKIVFVSKSIGTAVAAAYDSEHDINADHIYFTPVPETFSFVKEDSGIVFHGRSDPWCETAVVEQNCQKLRLALHTFEGANHSMETGDCLKDLEYMHSIIGCIKDTFFTF